LKESLQLNPRDSKQWQLLGSALMIVEQWEDAAKSLERAILLDPNSAFNWYNYGVCQFFQENFFISLRAIRQAFSIDPFLENIAEDWMEILIEQIQEFEEYNTVIPAAS
jgi:cytochrome c-type biogenesis protein CcmH/NrfG